MGSYDNHSYEAPLIPSHKHSIDSSDQDTTSSSTADAITHTTTNLPDSCTLSAANAAYHAEMYALQPKPDWLEQIENDPAYVEYVLKAHATETLSRRKKHFIGNDYVFHHPRFYYVFFVHRMSHSLCGSVLFTADCEGPPGRVHGGAIAAVFDQLLSITAWVSGYTGFSGTLTIIYKAGVPLLTHLYYSAHISHVERKKVFVDMQLIQKDKDRDRDKLLCTASGVWINIPNIPSKVKPRAAL